jgi:hypothetical protein
MTMMTMMINRQGRAMECYADANHGQLYSEDVLPC